MLWQLNFYELVGGEPPPPLLGQSRICQRVGGGSLPSLHFCVCVCACVAVPWFLSCCCCAVMQYTGIGELPSGAPLPCRWLERPAPFT
jgi:hypothetical protein